MFGVVMLVLVVLLTTVVAPLWIVAHYLTRWRAARALSAADERMLAELRDLAQAMDARIRNLERVLSVEVPGWREQA